MKFNSILLDMRRVFSFAQKMIFAAAVLILWSVNGWGQTTVTIGNGSSYTDDYPIDPYYKYSYSEQIVLQSEIGVAGRITKLYFYKSANLLTSKSNTWTVYMGHTSQTSYSSTTNWIKSGNMTQVFSGALSTTAGAGWYEIILDNSFDYNNTDNLVIAVDESVAYYDGDANYWRYSSTSTSNRVLYHSSDSYNQDPATCSYAGTLASYLNSMQLVINQGPTNPTFSNTGSSSQLAFNNSYINDNTPLFRASATHTASFNRFQVEINTNSTFTGTAYTQTFSGTYASGTQYDLDCNALSTALPTTNNITYYVRVRASADGGTNYGSWSSGTYSFTYKTSGDVDWYQKESAQFQSGTVVAASDDDYGNTATYEYGYGTLENDEMMWYRAYVTEAGNLKSVTVRLNGTDGNIKMAVYDSDGNKIAETNSTACVDNENTLTTTTNPILTADTYYYVAIMLSSNSQDIWYSYDEGESWGKYSTGNTYGTFPASLTSGTDWTKRFLIYLTTESDATTTSSAIQFASFVGASAFDDVTFSGSGTVSVGVYADAAATTQIIAPTSTSPIDISGVNTTTYPSLYLKATLTGASPSLDNWKVTGNYGSPAIITSTSTLSFSDQCYGTTSSEQTYTVEGTDLTDDITITPPEGFEISKTSGYGFVDHTGSLTLAEIGGSVSETTIYVRFSPSSEISYSGNIAHTSDGASNNNISISGDGVYSAPTLTAGAAGSITPSSAVVSTNTISNIGCSAVTTYGVEYSTTNGFSTGTGTQQAGYGFSGSSGGSFSASISGLESNTTYYYRAYATNSGGTAYSSQSSFTTPCGAETYPFFEGFETYSTNYGSVISQNSCYVGGGAGTWNVYHGGSNSGSNSAYFNWSDKPWLFIPVYLEEDKIYSFSAFASTPNGGYGVAYITVKFGTTATSAGMSSGTIINETIIPSEDGYTELLNTFSAPSTGLFYIGIFGETKTSTSSYRYLDDISITEIECTYPSNLSSSSITQTTATISWSAAAPAPDDGYEYYVSTSDVEPTEFTTPSGSVAAGVTSKAISGLSSGTRYYFWVRSVCDSGAGDYSDWAGSATFRTTCGAAAPPYLEGFETDFTNNGLVEGCYQQQVVSGTWEWTAYDNSTNAYAGDWYAGLYNSTERWLFMPFHFEAGVSYDVSFYATGTGDVSLSYGSNYGAANMTTSVFSNSALTSSYDEFTGIIEVGTTGDYYIGILGDNNSASAYLYLDNINVAPRPMYRSASDGNWNNTASWEISTDEGSTWVAATSTPSFNDNEITISHDITAAANVSVDEVFIHEDGNLIVNSGVTLTIANGIGVDVSVDGHITNAGTITTTGTLVFNEHGKYYHNYTTTAGTIPTSTWSSGSHCEISGYTSNASAPSGLGQSFHHFTWNCTSQSGAINLAGILTTVNGDLSIASTGSGLLALASTQSPTIAVVGDFIVSSGTAYMTTSSGTPVMNLSGNFNQTGGTLSKHSGSSNSSRINIEGNFNQQAGTITESGSVYGQIYFTAATGTQTFNQSGTISNDIRTYKDGAGTLQLTSNVTLPGLINFSAGTLDFGTSARTLSLGTGNSISFSGCTVDMSGNNAAHKIRITGSTSSVTFPTTWTHGTGDIFEFANTSSIYLNQALTFNNLEVTGSGYVYFIDNTTARTLNVLGNFTQTAGFFRMAESTGKATMNVSGDFILNGGHFRVDYSTAESILNISGDFEQNGGTFDLSNAAFAGSSISTLNMGGNFIQTSGTLTESGNTLGLIQFSKSGTQTYSQAGTISNTVRMQVDAGSTLSLESNASLPARVTINGTLLFGNFARTFSIENTSADVLQGNGTIDMQNADHILDYKGSSVLFNGTFVAGNSGTVRFSNNGNQTMPNWEYRNLTTAGTSGIKSFGSNFRSSVSILGNLTVNGTGSTCVYYTSSSNGIDGTLSIGGDLIVTAGTFRGTNNISDPTIEVQGDILVNGGNLFLSGYGNTDGIGIATYNVNGSLTRTSGVLKATDQTQTPATQYAIINFAGTGTGDFSASTGLNNFESSWDINIGVDREITLLSTINQGINSDFVVNGILNAGTNQISRINTGSPSSFTLNSGATLKTAHAAGITSDGSGGTVFKSAGVGAYTITFSSGANYVYNGSASQLTGSGLPASVNSLTIDNASGVNLSNNLEVSASLNLVDGILSVADGDELEISGLVTGASASSFVNGTMSRTGSGAFEFPTGHVVTRDIGSGSQPYEIYAPILITPSEASTFSARYMFTDEGLPQWWYHDWTHESPLKSVSNREYWIVDADKPISVILNWIQSGDCVHTLCDEDDIDVAITTVAFWDKDISKWRDAGGIITGGSSSALGSISSGLINFPFSSKGDGIPVGFGGKDPENPLAVELIYFTADCSNNNIVLSWATATESNSESFLVQKSNDMRHFTDVAVVKAAGNSVSEQKYQISDENKNNQKVYYRLLQKDFDSEMEILAAIVADCDKEMLDYKLVEIYPNPVTDVLTIMPAYNQINEMKIELSDQTGRAMFSQKYQVAGNNEGVYLDMSSFSPGVYYLKIETEDNQQITKVLKY